MELRDYLSALRRYWLTWFAITTLGVLLALVAFSVAPPVYQATAGVFVASTTDDFNGAQFVKQRVGSYPDVADSMSVLQPVIKQLGLPLTFQQLRAEVSASNPVDTSQIEITVTAGSSQQAADIADAVAQSLVEVVERLENPDGSVPPVTLTQTTLATPPSAPISPSLKLLLALGLAAGLALGLAVAIIRSRMDTRIHTAEDVRAAWDEAGRSFPVHDLPAGRRAGGAVAALTRQLEQMAESGPLRAVALDSSAKADANLRHFVEQVAEELTRRGISAAVADCGATSGRPLGSAPDTEGAPARVRLEVGSAPLALRDWRRLAADYDGVVIVVRTGRVDAGQLREMRSVLAAADIHPVAIAIVRGRGRARKPLSGGINDGRNAPLRGTAAPAGRPEPGPVRLPELSDR